MPGGRSHHDIQQVCIAVMEAPWLRLNEIVDGKKKTNGKAGECA